MLDAPSTILEPPLDRGTVGAAGRESAATALARPGMDRRGSRRPRVLFCAAMVSPERGSESAAGWNVAVRLARWCDVTVLCMPLCEGGDFRGEIEAWLRRHGPVAGLELCYVEPPLRTRWFQVPGVSPLRPFFYVGYGAWQRAAWRAAERLHLQDRFDLIHQFNISGYREPGWLWKLDAPFLWGPIGGADNVPWRHFSLLGWRDRLFYGVRNVMNLWQMRRRRCRLAAGRASIIWAIGNGNEQMVRQRWGREARLMLDSGAVIRGGGVVKRYDGSRALRLVWSGLHIGRKALPILFHAMAALEPEIPVELSVLGSGNQTERWKALAGRLGLGPRVRWFGQLPHSQAIEALGEADVLAFTSLLEGMPHTVLEAISLGLPVICHDTCGMSVAVDDTCGIRVPVVDTRSSIEGFAAAIRRLASGPLEVERLSRGALARAEQLSWDNKAMEICKAYESILDNVAR